MNNKPIIVVAGEPNSIFVEIFIKSLKKTKNKSPIILIISKKIFKLQMRKLKLNCVFKDIEIYNVNKIFFENKKIYLLDINYNTSKAFEKISNKSNKYINSCFEVALKLINLGITNKLINGPISKKHFLKKKFLGVTEYLAYKTKSSNFAMLIYNKKLSVSPITTHLPIKFVTKKITKKLIIQKILLINDFYKNYFNISPRIAVTGINPHCESISLYNEDTKIVKPSVEYLKRKINVVGPISSDTIFLKKNRSKYDVIIGMYHDQVLTPIKTLHEYKAVNVTIGFPFIRVSPDHGPNESMLGKNLSNPQSLIEALNFFNN